MPYFLKYLKFKGFLVAMLSLSFATSECLALDELNFVGNSSQEWQNEYSFGPRDAWFGVYYKDARIGHVSQNLRRDRDDGYIVSEIEKQIEIEDGTIVKVNETLKFSDKAPYLLQEGEYRKQRGRETLVANYVRGEGTASIHRTSFGITQTERVAPLNYRLSDYFALEDTLTSGATSDTPVSFKTLAPGEFKLQKMPVRYSSLDSNLENKIANASFEINVMASPNSSKATHYYDKAGQPLLMLFGSDFRVVREKKVLARAVTPLRNPKKLSRVKSNRYLARPENIRHLIIEISSSTEPAFLPTSARQEVIRDTERGKTFLHTRQTSDSDLPTEDFPDPKYLEQTLDYPVANPQIQNLSRILTHSANSDSGKVIRLLQFVSKHLIDDDKAHLSVLASLQNRKGNCRDSARLFTTLARAAGIPAREVSGLVYTQNKKKGFEAHSWNEVYVAGRWLSVDPTFNKPRLDPTYISFGTGKQGLQNLVRTMGTISLKIIKVKYHEI